MTSSIERGLEEYLARVRRFQKNRFMADWERDTAFMALALTLWPDDCEASAMGRDSNRSRMRLRYQGYKALANAKEQVQALQHAAQAALDSWGLEVDP